MLVIFLRSVSPINRYFLYTMSSFNTWTQVNTDISQYSLYKYSLEIFRHTYETFRIIRTIKLSKDSFYVLYNTAISSFLTSSLKAPRLLLFYVFNHFHGFYECVWALEYYLAGSLVSWDLRSVPAVVRVQLFSNSRKHAWDTKIFLAFFLPTYFKKSHFGRRTTSPR